jgi:hypothetical protein
MLWAMLAKGERYDAEAWQHLYDLHRHDPITLKLNYCSTR